MPSKSPSAPARSTGWRGTSGNPGRNRRSRSCSLRAHERFPEARPRILSENGPPCIARDFKQFIRRNGRTPVRTGPYCPQRNGKRARWQQSAKTEGLRPQAPQSREDALRIVTKSVEHDNTVRLHRALGYVTPQDKREGRAQPIFAARAAKLERARPARRAAATAQAP